MTEPDARDPGASEPAGEEPEADDTPAEEPGAPTVHGCPVVDSLGAEVVHCGRDAYLELMTALKGDGYAMMVGVCGVDYLTHPGRDLPEGVDAERFEVVVELMRVADRHRLRVRCQVPATEPAVPSLFDLWMGSEAHEREVYDMFGISFDGHPDPSRILMPEDWEGHPLRKDYASGRIPVQFKESPGGR
ncbi:MAG: NADH-quinone oxidoreductase subunit C [Acidimicrobiales bacterium]